MSFRPLTSASSDDKTPAECARAMADAGAVAVGANCEQEPSRMLGIMWAMREAVDVPLAAQPAAFRTTNTLQAFTKIPEFPDDLETVQVSRTEFFDFAKNARNEGIGYLGGCCGANASYIRSMRAGLDATTRRNAASYETGR